MWGSKSTTVLSVEDMKKNKVLFDQWSKFKSWTDSEAENISLLHDRIFVCQSDGNFRPTYQSQKSRPVENTKLFCYWWKLMVEKFRRTVIPSDCCSKVQMRVFTYVGIGSQIGQKVDHAYEIWILFDCMTCYAMATDLGVVHIWRQHFFLLALLPNLLNHFLIPMYYHLFNDPYRPREWWRHMWMPFM